MEIRDANLSEEFKEKLFHFIESVESNEKYQSVKDIDEEEFDEDDPFFKLLREGNVAAIDLLLGVLNSKEFEDQVNEKYDKKFNQAQC